MGVHILCLYMVERNNLSFFLQGIAIKKYLWVSEESLNFDFLDTIVTIKDCGDFWRGINIFYIMRWLGVYGEWGLVGV